MKISSATIGLSKTNMSVDTFVGAGGANRRSSSTPDPFPWKWSWNATEQYVGNSTTAFTASAGTDEGGFSSYFTFSANSGYGVRMQHDDTLNMMGTAARLAWWDIRVDDARKQDGTSLTSGTLDGSVTQTGEYLTFIYSGYQGTGAVADRFNGADSYVYWAIPADADNDYDGDYSAAVGVDSLNVEGDLIYVTFNMNGTTAKTVDGGSETLAWESANSTFYPRFISHQPWTSPNIDNEATFRGAIIWDVADTPGNTAISMPIRTS